MNCIVLRAHVVTALTMVNEKGDKTILEPLIVKQTIIIRLKELSFIAVTRITLEDVHKMSFSRQRDDHGEMKKGENNGILYH